MFAKLHRHSIILFLTVNCESECLVRARTSQISRHDTGSELVAALQVESADIRALTQNVQTEERAACQVSEQKGKVAIAEIVSGHGQDSTADSKHEDSVDDDIDMGFSTFVPASLPNRTPPPPPPAGNPKRRRKETQPAPPAPSPSGNDAPEKPEAQPETPAPKGVPGPRRPIPPANRRTTQGEEAPAIPKPPVPSAGQTVVSKAKKLFEDKQASLSDEKLWEGKLKKRQVETGAKQLEDSAGKLLGDPTCFDLINQMTEMSQQIVRKFEFLSDLKKDPARYIDQMDQDSADIFCALSPSLAATVIVSVATHLLKDVEQDAVEFDQPSVPPCLTARAWIGLVWP